ncbi:sulfurtransferase complex subunit TusD [Psychrobacter sp. AOP22-C1-22]|uniref:sulfurtransferase complex subunit TusD n=1 Tax=unclassified Psychrobacter TaxID=196806 RepID=UPI001787E51E|nr:MULTISPECIES: sulfurtransferase complex subunit TusD [unclassified Psychrobacter]MBE0406164.1 sulfurtransferase complex subunit TusD [Psychrobacter sp. FME6]MBE0443834.1 sulfurtransferase complex subunit TusD [Psychrobacter sp. FME5]MDN5802095.1 sulfurtransferase complex subunit TusD [Psychrobacter sp.]MDN5891662.1 sulfurtransferase complex subunit TusD [Psychrobacter sp.]
MTTPTTTASTPLLLITADPSHPLAQLALRYARAYLQSSSNQEEVGRRSPLNVFFYADAAHTANRLRWQSADQIDLTKEWQTLAEQYQLSLPVCVSTALSRGISDSDNSKRHQLDTENLAQGFTLVGLSELAMMMQEDCRLVQF